MNRQFTPSEINTICHALALAQEDCRRVAVKVLEHPPPSPPPALQTPDQQARARHMEETRKNLSETMSGYARGFKALLSDIEDHQYSDSKYWHKSESPSEQWKRDQTNRRRVVREQRGES